jgi:hypothetical protein
MNINPNAHAKTVVNNNGARGASKTDEVVPPRNDLQAPVVHQERERVEENQLDFGFVNNPFTPWIISHDLPQNFQFAKKLDDYDGSRDPTLHFSNIEHTMFFQGVKEPIVCWAFS